MRPVDDGGISRRTLLLGAGGLAVVAGGGAALAPHELNAHPHLRRILFGCGPTPPIPHSEFRVVNGSFASTAMKRQMPWQVALPPAPHRTGPTPLVIVLPGASGTPSGLSTGVGLPGFATAAGLNVAFAAPGNGGTIYYHPRASGLDPMSWVLSEFIPMVERRFDVGGRVERRAIYGMSMGGFGALLFAAQAPRHFVAAVASSPAVFESYDAAVRGHPTTFDSAADWQRWGLWERLGDLNGVPVMIDCGDADPFAPTARDLLRRLPGATGAIGHGCHDFGFWRRQAPAQLQFLRGHFAA